MGKRLGYFFAVILLLGLPATLLIPSTNEPYSAQEKSEDAQELLDDGIESLSFGSSRAVRRIARKLKKIEGYEELATWLQNRSELEYGDARKALKALDKAKAGEAESIPLRNLYCEVLFQCGDYVRLDEATDAFFQAHKTEALALYQRGRYLHTTGKNGASDFLQLAMRAAGNLSKEVTGVTKQFNNAEAFHAAGRAALLLDQIKSASEYFYDGAEAYEFHNGCRVDVGFNLLVNGKKHRSALVNSAQPVLIFNAKSVPALLLKAGVQGVSAGALKQKATLDQAVAANRKSWNARMARANFHIRHSNYAAASKDLEAAAKTNSSDLHYLATMALLAKCQGNQIKYEEWEVEARKLNTKIADFYLHVGKGLRSRLLLEDAVKVFLRGIEIDETLWRLHREVGFTYLDLGLPEKGLPYLEIAVDKDLIRNAVDTQNMILLFEEYYQDLQKFEILDGRVSLQIMKKDAELLLPYYTREFERGFAEISEKYGGFMPKKPLYVDVFPDSDTFSVRTIGIKGIPASGVCFGQLVNLAGPLALGGNGYNWSATLVHELDHVFQLQMSNGQIPRWLAEGSSVYQEKLRRSEWERHHEEELYQIFSAGRLPKVVDFNAWFYDASSVLFAYYLGGVMVDFIANELADMATITHMIRDFGGAYSLEDVFQRNLKMTPDEFDSKFAEFVEKKLERFKILAAVSLDDPRDLIEKAEDSEASVDELVRLARWYFQQDKTSPDARKWAGLAVKMGGDSAELYYVRGMLAKYDPSGTMSAAKQLRVAREYLAKAINLGLEDYYLYMELADIAQQTRDNDAAIFYLNRARRAFPTNPVPLQRLIGVYTQAKNTAKVEELAVDLIRLDKNNVQQRGWLLNRYRQVGNFEKAADMAMQVIHINPYIVDSHLIRGKMLREIGELDEAIFEFRRAYDAAAIHEQPAAQMQGKESALLEIAETWLETGDNEKLEEAMKDLEKEFGSSPRFARMKSKIAEDEEEIHFP